ncbi:hypothetical protein V6N13_034139 [Hibiscus sabdariffa]
MDQTSAYMARTDRFIQKIDAFMDIIEMKLQNHDAILKSLETQVGQISQILSTRPIGGFPSDTEVAKGATHEQCKAIIKYQPRRQIQGASPLNVLLSVTTPPRQLCDPGASINLMPKSVIKKLGIGEAKPTILMLQLADHSFFIFPVDILILECEADENAPIILGRPFFSTSRARIEFDKDEIVFKVDNEQVKMKALTNPRQPEHKDKGKGIDNTPVKSTQKPKLYMGAHTERDKGVMFLRDA